MNYFDYDNKYWKVFIKGPDKKEVEMNNFDSSSLNEENKTGEDNA